MKKLYFIFILAAIVTLSFNCSNTGEAENKTEKNNEAVTQQSNEKAETQNGEKSDKESKNDTDAVPVQVISPSRGDISSFLLFSSNIDSEKVVDIYPMTSGIIQKINRHVGDSVAKGQILAVLDDREASLNQEKALLNYQQLQGEFKRQEEIFEKALISKEDYEKLKFRVDAAFLDWKQAKLLLSYTRITSPISGVVSSRYIKAGNKITMAQLAFSVVNTREKIAAVNIPAQEKEHIYLKQKSLVSSGTKSVPASVKRISPSIDPESGTFKVTVEIKDPKGILAVGEFVNVKIIRKIHKNVILLRKDALIYDGGKIFVFVIDKDNKAVKKMIELDFEDGTLVEVTKGLGENDRVVTAGKSSLKTKTRVKVVDPIIS